MTQMPTSAARLRTVRQIVDADGNPYAAHATSNLWVSDTQRFANKTEGNAVQAFTAGRDYFKDLVQAVMGAQHDICIAGWQVSWDALVAPGLRMYDLLFDAAAKNPVLRIRVMPWNDTEPIQTYDDETLLALHDINERLRRDQVRVVLSPSYAHVDKTFFSHHQKQVVIDQRIAYVGGMDICYGRYDDERFKVKLDPALRSGMNRYNGCIEPMGVVDSATAVNPHKLIDSTESFNVKEVKSAPGSEKAKLRAGGWQIKYKSAGIGDIVANSSMTSSNEPDTSTLDPQRQPRMPWQDVHARIEGPAVDDLLRNFAGRWNIVAPQAWRLPVPGWGSAPSCKQPKPGQAHVQVLRSAPAAHCAKEYAALTVKPGTAPAPKTQHDIYTAMLTLIDKATRFIYIENQFFVSAFGDEVVDQPGRLSPAAQFIDVYEHRNQQRSAAVTAYADSTTGFFGQKIQNAIRAKPTNEISMALVRAIREAIMNRHAPFHVYITLPVHPEGELSDASVVTQVHFTMQTLAFGSQSLLTGIRRALKARELRDAKDPNYKRAYEDDANTEYESVDIERCWDWVTLLNLRNWSVAGTRYITEQVYVHSKCMIVDDMYALVGSANINDRSLLGDRDSELAVLVMDGENKRADIHGAGTQQPVCVFAHELRKSLWKKIFGITAGGQYAADELAQAIEEPGNPASWKAIQARARKNAEIYEDVFPWVPRNWVSGDEAIHANILPTWDPEARAPVGAPWV